MIHIPVLVSEISDTLDIQQNDIFLDGTLGFGGHAGQLSQHLGPSGIYIGLDQDIKAINHCETTFKKDPRFKIFHRNFSDAKTISNSLSVKPNKILLDLGYSSFQLDQSNRGFSFMEDEPLDMRMNQNQTQTAANILKTYSQKNLSDIFFHYADLYQNKYLCEAIVKTRKTQPIETTHDLIKIIKNNYRFKSRSKMMKVYSQVFQALRIETNHEFEHIQSFLDQLPDFLAINGRVAIISFHSIEDRLIKKHFKTLKNFTPITKKPLIASAEEIKENTRSKSAKLRVYLRNS